MKKNYLFEMTRWSFIFCLVLAMVVAGCSGDVAPIDPVNPDNVIDQDIYSDVPIEFGYGGMTKAPMTTISEKDNFGIFSVEEGTDDLTKLGDLNINNVIINYISGYGFKFAPSSLRFYYPIGDKKYKFYAYYAYRNNESVNMADDESYMFEKATMVRFYSYSHNGASSTFGSHKGDVLYAKAMDRNGNDAFNSSVVKESGNPSFTFKHATAALHFKVSLDLTREDFRTNGYLITIAGLRLMNSPSQADLCLIDLENPLREGTFLNKVYADKTSNRPLLQNKLGNSGALNYDIDADFTSDVLGSGYMFVVPQEEPIECIMHVYRVDPNNPKFKAPYYYKFKLDPRDYGLSSSAHEAGKLYNYNIVLDWGATATGSVGPIVKMKGAEQTTAEEW